MGPDHRRLKLISAILVAALLGLLFARIDGIRIATADEQHAMAAATEPITGQASRVLDLCIGRFYAVIKWPVLETLMRDCSDGLLSGLRIGAFFLCVIAAARFLRDALQSEPAGVLFLVLVCALLPVLVTYQPLFYNPLLWLGWACIWLIGNLSLKPDTPGNSGLIAGLFILALMSHEMNAVFVVWPWLVHNATGVKGWKVGFSRPTILCGIILAAYGAISIAVRLATAKFGIDYTGGTIAYDVPAALLSLMANSLGVLPGLELWLQPRWQGMDSPMFNGPTLFLERLFSNLGPASYVLCGGVGAVTWLFLRSPSPARTAAIPVRPGPLAGVLTFMVFAPNLLLSLTEKYQLWAFQKMWPYYYSWMSYLALVMIMVLLLDRIRVRLPERKKLTVTLALAIALLAAVSAAAAQEATDFFREYRFDHSDVPPTRHD